jgi:enamine deaminase RidA (YjgF/YER057c/UK114 family)
MITKTSNFLFTPAAIRQPSAKYSYGCLVPEGSTLVFTAGQVGTRRDGSVPTEIGEQATVTFQNIRTVLREVNMDIGDIIRLNTYLIDAADVQAYMAVRDRIVSNPPPASTLLVVTAFADPRHKIEIEAVAAQQFES